MIRARQAITDTPTAPGQSYHMRNKNHRSNFMQACLLMAGNERLYRVSGNCAYCGKQLKEGDIAIYSTYWHHIWEPVHETCLAPHKANTELCCQTIDVDCNDFRDFSRHNANAGTCIKKSGPFEGQAVTANPNFCSMRACFTHRLKTDSDE